MFTPPFIARGTPYGGSADRGVKRGRDDVYSRSGPYGSGNTTPMPRSMDSLSSAKDLLQPHCGKQFQALRGVILDTMRWLIVARVQDVQPTTKDGRPALVHCCLESLGSEPISSPPVSYTTDFSMSSVRGTCTLTKCVPVGIGPCIIPAVVRSEAPTASLTPPVGSLVFGCATLEHMKPREGRDASDAKQRLAFGFWNPYGELFRQLFRVLNGCKITDSEMRTTLRTADDARCDDLYVLCRLVRMDDTSFFEYNEWPPHPDGTPMCMTVSSPVQFLHTLYEIYRTDDVLRVLQTACQTLNISPLNIVPWVPPQGVRTAEEVIEDHVAFACPASYDSIEGCRFLRGGPVLLKAWLKLARKTQSLPTPPAGQKWAFAPDATGMLCVTTVPESVGVPSVEATPPAATFSTVTTMNASGVVGLGSPYASASAGAVPAMGSSTSSPGNAAVGGLFAAFTPLRPVLPTVVVHRPATPPGCPPLGGQSPVYAPGSPGGYTVPDESHLLNEEEEALFRQRLRASIVASTAAAAAATTAAVVAPAGVPGTTARVVNPVPVRRQPYMAWCTMPSTAACDNSKVYGGMKFYFDVPEVAAA